MWKYMIETIAAVNQAVNSFIWGIPAMVCIIGVGLLLSVRTGFLQIRKFPYAIKTTIGRMFRKKDASDGAMTPFQAVCTALAGTVGTGNIAGVAGAIAIGGPGAVFWMWCPALLGMCTKFAEVTLAVYFRERSATGEWVGGPAYYLRGLGKKIGVVFGVGYAFFFMIELVPSLASQGVSAAEQFNVFGANQTITGIIIAVLVGVILAGGFKRVSSVTDILVPVMACLYVAGALVIIFANVGELPAVFSMIFQDAFTGHAAVGGFTGATIMAAIRWGAARGVYSNEAGVGSTIAGHCTAETDHPIRQAQFGIFEVFMDTIVICTLTALVILCSGTPVTYGKAAGAELTISGFTSVYGSWISVFTAVAMCCFAFSTIIGWGLYGARCIEFLFSSEKIVKPFMVVYSLVAILGATVELGLLWSIAETFNGLMAIPNLIAVFLLSGTVVKMVKEYFAAEGK